jgi:RimJ/RimL family protein N-acetyltransferase
VRIVLEPVSPELARALVAGDGSAVRAGDGWPHADSLDGIGMVLHGGEAWLVLLGGVVIGDCGTVGPPEGGEVEIGYGLAEPYRGRGHGTEIVTALIELLAVRPAVRRVLATVRPDNAPSRRALERAGFALVRPRGDLLLYARQA